MKPASIELGPYQLLERIGEGGNGQVFRAKGPSGPVAIKMLGPANAMDDAAQARFRREITALGQIRHAHLISLLDHGVDAELGPYLVLPLLAGTNLRALCAGAALCPEAALLLIQPIAQATAALHAGGFVHRDLKPENVFAGPDGAITVIDLGLAWRDGMTRHTDTGAAVGSIGYMSPEQIEGRPVDDRADVWALGVMIYEWIVGTRPFARPRGSEEAAAMLLGTCPRLTAADRRASDELADLVARCLSVDSRRRPSGAELVAAIATMIDWTDAIESERAAMVANPAGYQARIAPFRVRRLERLAREAIDAGKPFVALGWCDRGLAYAPEHAELLALVAAAERSTAQSATASPAPSTTAERSTAQSATAERSTAPSTTASTAPSATAERSTAQSAEQVVAPAAESRRSSTSPPVAVAAPSEPTRKWARRWPWLIVAACGIAVGATTVYLVIPDRTSRDPWEAPAKPPSTPVTPSPIDDRDRALAHDVVSLFGQAMANGDPGPHTATGRTPTTATGWLDLASSQEPSEAVASIRHALVLSPEWSRAQAALCVALAAAHDDGAIAACDTAIVRRPTDPTLFAARGAARLDAGRPSEALVDLDRAVAADPDPKWRRLRAKARLATGDRIGAKRDLDSACQLGDAIACRDAKP